ncbi:MAG: MCE family protein [Pseudomonadota bacterium]|nr:MCE family protein [Pseudomonadota bacterium]
METRANFIAIGAFTLAVVVGAFLFVLWMAGYGGGANLAHYRVVFQGSVSGLARGGVVLFNGLRVGEVKSVDFLKNDPGRVAAEIDVDSRIPVLEDTKVRLEMQGLTGASAVALTGGAPDAKPVVAKNGEPPTLIAEPSQIQNLLVNVQNISTKADSVLTRADKLFADSGPAFSDTMKNINTFSKSLGDASSGLSGAVAGIGEIGRKIGPLAGRLEKLTDDADKLLGAVDAAKVRHSVDDVAAFAASLGDKEGPTQKALADAGVLVKHLNDTAAKLDAALSDVDTVAKAFDAKKVGQLVEGAAAIGQTLSDNRANLDHTLKDAAEIAAKLHDSANKVDGLMTSASSFLGSADTKGPLSQVGEAAESIKRLADQMNLRVRQMSPGLVNFSNSGLKDYQAMAIDARRTLTDLDRVILSIEKHPTQLIFGSK